MSKSREWKEKRERVVKERLPKVIKSLEEVGLKDFKITDFSITFDLNSRHVEFSIFTGTIIWEGKNPEKLGKGIRELVKMIEEEEKKGTLDSYREDDY